MEAYSSSTTVLESIDETVGVALNEIKITSNKAAQPIQPIKKKRSPLKDQKLSAVDTLGNVYTTPEFTLKDIISAVPKHCFRKNNWISFSYILQDASALIVLGILTHYYIMPMVDNVFLRFVCWCLYSFGLGAFMTGLWVVGHDCSHNAFSETMILNDIVGWFLHSYTLEPFFAWKDGHNAHHKSNANIQKDNAWVPIERERYLRQHGVKTLKEIGEEAPVVTLLNIIIRHLIGFFLHIVVNASGQYYSRFYPGEPDTFANRLKTSHFNPKSPIFSERFRNNLSLHIVSDIGVLITIISQYYIYSVLGYGWFNFMVNYFIPYLWFNHWVVLITFLQHFDPILPKYDDSAWTYVRGGCCTIDRSLGFLGKYITHLVSEAHVIHHFCPTIPHYHAMEATEAIKPVMGEHYKSTDESLFVSVYKVSRLCQFVEGSNGMLMFRNTNNLGVPPQADDKQ
ncbi:oleate delta-12 desaturase [Ascoidea rubescens DSM 1968]|uniref:Oleate delta-12 desaturase n=1 Tax=Ascoidea rubescens DSM 1968 TaxID=1344418 RepID=A0A1D2VEC2_9ASCO|nr:oleate delta-12 desaturase [Ascoidea rubescens DSM 1968]ODV60034.1 oleate delta-12 desaturase [Ascoidea rubescens DSM 1968]